MPKSISDYLEIDAEAFEATGAYNGFVDEDTKVFIDPRLLKSTETPELQNSYERVRDHFTGIVKLLSRVQTRDDVFWRNAKRKLRFNEVRGLCIGYSDGTTEGSGIGEGIQSELLATASKIIEAGVEDPEMFELMGLFEENVGADRISDMIAHIIMPDLLAYSERIFKEYDVPASYRLQHAGQEYCLPRGPHSGIPIILVPKDILNDLPVAHSYEDIQRVVAFNDQLRAELNDLVGDAWGNRPPPKSAYKRAILRDPSILAELIKIYKNMSPEPYDFDTDPLGLRSIFQFAEQFASDFPLNLNLPPRPTPQHVMNLVVDICKKFKRLIEYNGLHEHLYQDSSCSKARPERATQTLFHAIAKIYCEANDLDISPEPNSGRGPVDFKISKGFHCRILVETKLSSNTRLEHGYDKQLNEYQRAEETDHAIYLVMDVGSCSDERWGNFWRAVGDAKSADKRVPEVIYVNGKCRPSASKI